MVIKLPLNDSARQVMTIDIVIDGYTLHAKLEVRYLSAPDIWVLSIWDHSDGTLLVNQISLVCSYGEINDLLGSYKHIRKGRGIGSLYVLRAVDEPSSADPSAGNLNQFQILWGDSID